MKATKEALLAKLPTPENLDRLDDDEMTGKRLWALNLTIGDIRELHFILADGCCGHCHCPCVKCANCGED